MKQLKIRVARPEDAEQIAKWLVETPNNLFDEEILRYPTFSVVSAYNGDGNVAHLPSQLVVMMESLAVRPGASLLDAVQGFRDLVKAIELIASQRGIREIYFVCKDEDVLKIAQNHGFERIEFPVVRLRL